MNLKFVSIIEPEPTINIISEIPVALERILKIMSPLKFVVINVNVNLNNNKNLTGEEKLIIHNRTTRIVIIIKGTLITTIRGHLKCSLAKGMGKISHNVTHFKMISEVSMVMILTIIL